MSNKEAKITGRLALNGDGRRKHLGKAKRAANKATRRAGKVTL
tara:strand:+ start:2880 stop:3008 length:129 start_codon:yes stop_codon:yes gene_type:complete